MPRFTGIDKSGFRLSQIVPLATGTLPFGVLACDGAAISRTTYAALFSSIGTAFGVGDGSTTFNVPDLRGKAMMGAGQDTGRGLTARTVGQYLGEETHILIAGELPNHIHTFTTSGASADHTHAVSRTTTVDIGSARTALTLEPSGSFVSTAGESVDHTHTGSTDALGAGTNHNNIQPSVVAQYAIAYI